jgi:hypothetical protein
MDNQNQFDAVRYQTVEFSNRGVTLFDGQSKLLFVDKIDIRQITLKFGLQSERPVVEIVFGIFVVGLGIYFFTKFLLEILVNRIAYVDDVLSLLLLPVGGWFVFDGFRKRLYFEVGLENDTRKFPLGKKPDMAEMKKFVKAASQLGYVIDITFIDEKTNV